MATRAAISRRRIIAAVAGAFLGQARFGGARAERRRAVIAALRGAQWEPDLKAAFTQGLSDGGLGEGRDYELVVRSMDGEPERLPGLVTDLVAMRPTVILGQTTGIAVALRQATDAIPILATLTNPVELGLAASIGHPGGNVS